MNDKQKSAESATATGEKFEGFTAEERAAMKDRATELKTASRRGRRAAKQEDGATEVLAKIAEMAGPDRAMGERLHAVIMASVPDLSPRLWYGMPAYARDGQMICFFQPAAKFKSRYATLGFSDKANLDDGNLWPVEFALTKLTDAVEERICALLKSAAS